VQKVAIGCLGGLTLAGHFTSAAAERDHQPYINTIRLGINQQEIHALTLGVV